MGAKVAGHWELGWETPFQEYNWWIHPLREFGVENFYMSPVTGIGKEHVTEKRNIEEVLLMPENIGYRRIYVDENGENSLEDFDHPEYAIYIFGRTSYNVMSNSKSENDISLKIPTIRNAGGFWAHQAMSIVLYDRFIKGGN